jgi:hypothetical protein
MGLLFVQAVQNVDVPIMAAYLLLVALILSWQTGRNRGSARGATGALRRERRGRP